MGLGVTLGFLFLIGERDTLPPAKPPMVSPADTPSASDERSVGAMTPTPKRPPAGSGRLRRVIDETHRFHFAREGVLGTSFDLTVIADNPKQAKGVETRVLQEIAKRERIISTYRNDSEIGALNVRPFKAGERIDISLSLWLLLEECAYVNQRSAGAFNAFSGDTRRLWQAAAANGKLPADAALKTAAAINRQAFRLSGRKDSKWVERLAPGRFDFDAIGKGYVIDKCIREAVDDFPSLRGLKLNLGGEIKVWGQADYARNYTWQIGIADPRNPADNAEPLTMLELRNLAVATSGNYARPLRIAERTVNHVFDPRTARPVSHVQSATVVASTAQRADALATALCVMLPEKGIAMIDAMSDCACLIVAADGKQFRSSAFAAMERPREATATTQAWPEGNVVNIGFKLVRSETRAPFHRHYVGAWVENEAGRRIRLLALWAKPADIGYVRDLDEFWRDAWLLAGEGTDTRRMLGFSRATRPPGEYSLTWDGLNDAGQPVPQGTYTIHIDVNREKGPPNQRERHSHAALQLHCGAEPQSVKATDQPELQWVRAFYGPVGGQAP